jgi:hypothetical protein
MTKVNIKISTSIKVIIKINMSQMFVFNDFSNCVQRFIPLTTAVLPVPKNIYHLAKAYDGILGLMSSF